MDSALKIRLEVDEQIGGVLDGQSKILNWLYNCLLEKANRLKSDFIKGDKEAGKILYSAYGLRDLIPKLKREFSFLKAVYSSPAKNVAFRLKRSIEGGREDKKKKDWGEKKKPARWPRYRSWKKKWFSILYEEPWKGYRLEGREITLSLGKDEGGKQLRVKVKLTEKPPKWFCKESVKELRITKEGKYFYAIFTCTRNFPPEREKCKNEKEKKILALDPNHKNLAYGIDTEGKAVEIYNPYFLKALDLRIDGLKKRRDLCEKKSKEIEREDGSRSRTPSRRWCFFNERVQEAYRIRREQTKAYLFCLANRLFEEYDVVSIGQYTPQGGGINRGMRRSMNNQSLIGRFKEVLSWVALKRGKIYLEWDEEGSTRTCCKCGGKVEGGISPSIRLWRCGSCKTVHIRDENAAQNGLKETLKKLELPCSGRPVEVTMRRAWRWNGLGVQRMPGVVPRQEEVPLLPTARKLIGGA